MNKIRTLNAQNAGLNLKRSNCSGTYRGKNCPDTGGTCVWGFKSWRLYRGHTSSFENAHGECWW